ncbi:levansucrase [Terribacillus aidingensis]|uniref:Levansucrase n=1 Tax=Terribacillus aidingensis TaxID=586416 RepID=A0A285N1S4_9BACI|nr:glycoside hydrolase family 68 protein [Terribacillus aidingensis]SNZ03278.1 levansucrase [Terribacillus aidingensis]
MKFQKRALKASVVSLSAALILGSSLTVASAKTHEGGDVKPFKETYGASPITRQDMEQMIGQHGDKQFTVPSFDASSIKNIKSATKIDENGNEIKMDVWDTWPLQNTDGTVAEYNGYHLVFGLAGDPKDASDTFIYLFYKKADDTSVDAWKNAGRVFEDEDKYKGDKTLAGQQEEWSGSATFTEDGEVRLFYTNRGGWNDAEGIFGRQSLTTAQVNVSEKSQGTLQVDGVEDHKTIYSGGDSETYENMEKAFEDRNFANNHTLRDPHYIEDKGKKYLVFEANTGTEYGYSGEESLYNRAYYGNGMNYFREEFSQLQNSGKKDTAELANGAIGIIEINDDYTIKKEMKPLIVSNTVTDEIERPNIFKKDGKFYLFTSTRGSKMTIDGIDNQDIYMLGYVANNLTGPYKPMNKTGIVLHQDLDPNDLTWTYAHYVIPQKESDKFVVTSYMTNRGFFQDHKSTFAPSFLLDIDGKRSSVVEDGILDQGQITYEEE